MIEPTRLADRQLRRRYNDLRQTGVFGPGVHLFAMEREALAVAKASRGGGRLVGFTLAMVLDAIARRMDEDEVEHGRGGELLRRMDQPVKAAIDLMCGDGGSAEQVATNLINALFET
jgi:hypothetical protein